MDRIFFVDGGMKLLEQSLDLATKRQALLSSNLSNVDTPGYKTVDIDFEQELKKAAGDQGIALEMTNARHLSSETGARQSHETVAKKVKNLPMRNDANNVNVDREMALMAMNNLRFEVSYL